MDSIIYLKEKVQNKDRKFGSNLEYYPCKIILENGNEAYALFTESQINIAIQRASINPEDIPKEKSWLAEIFGF